jgi:hypothetical protein
MKAKEFIPQSRPRNFVAKNQKTAGAGAHKDKKRAEKQGDIKHKQKQFDEQNIDEGWKDKVAAAGLAGAMAFGASGAHARVAGDQDPGINRLTGKPIATQQATDNAPAKASTGYSKEYLLKEADPNRVGRYLISVEKARELLNNIKEQGVTSGTMNELSSELLGRYKKGASASATAADKAGDYAKGNKRFSGIVKATKKQFSNDSKDTK